MKHTIFHGFFYQNSLQSYSYGSKWKSVRLYVEALNKFQWLEWYVGLIFASGLSQKKNTTFSKAPFFTSCHKEPFCEYLLATRLNSSLGVAQLCKPIVSLIIILYPWIRFFLKVFTFAFFCCVISANETSIFCSIDYIQISIIKRILFSPKPHSGYNHGDSISSCRNENTA